MREVLRTHSRWMALAAVVAISALLAGPAAAQPFGNWLVTQSASSGDYIEIPHHPDLNPTSEFTFEAWVIRDSGTNCVSLAGKGWQSAWWVGDCSNRLRSYLRGSNSVRDAGEIPIDVWTHIAVTYDGATRKHYINGEQVGSWDEPAPLTTNSEPMRISSDVNWSSRADGSIDQVRLWNQARTKGELRAYINEPITSPMPGLVGVWDMNGGNTEVGPHDGNLVGGPLTINFPAGGGCVGGNATTLCLDNRFIVRGDWRRPDDSTGKMMTVPAGTNDSGLFWFFNPNNWEVLVKVLDGCGFGQPHYWVFFSSTTNVYYRMEVFDIVAGEQKIYFNYPGPPAPAVTDTTAFATCP